MNAIGAGGCTPLHRATMIADKELVHVLMDWNADVTVQDTDGMTALQRAVRNGHQHIQQLLQHHQAPMLEDDAGDRDALHQALEIQAPDTEPVTPRDEVSGAKEDMYRHLRERFGPNDARLRSEILRAALEGDLGAFMVLLDIIGDIDLNEGLNITYDEKQTLLEVASQRGHNAVVEALLAAGASVDESVGLQTPLFLATENGHETVVKTLLAAGADVEAANRGTTPLQVASRRGADGIVKRLLDAGANADGWSTGVTPLVYAAENGHNTIVEQLLVAGADIEANRGTGTALERASYEGWNDIVKMLLVAGANIQGKYGMTPLQRASQQGHSDIVSTLVLAGADVEEARVGKTALRIALDRGHKEIAATLRWAGARSGAARVAYVALRRLGIKDEGKMPGIADRI